MVSDNLHADDHNASWKNYYYTDKKVKFIGKGNDCSVYIGNLPQDFLLDECLKLLESVGKIYKIRLVNERCVFDCSNGHALVTYHNPLDAEKATEHFNKYEVREGTKIKVFLNRLQRKIIVRNIPMELSDEQLYLGFSQKFAGLKTVTGIKYKRKTYPFDKENMGFAILEFTNYEIASKAMRFFSHKCDKFWGKNINAQWIEPGKLHRHVIITGLPPNVSKERLSCLLTNTSKNGLVRYMLLGEALYVEFKSNLQAEAAREKLSGYDFDGVKLQNQWNLFPNESIYIKNSQET